MCTNQPESMMVLRLDNVLVLKLFHNRTERMKWRSCFAELLGNCHRLPPLESQLVGRGEKT